ncbi:MAG: hypothetical protein JRM83_08455, partial [Nitrososphaerota archaeon]|nr:hypothetical protein [Nitrososphaerota archaeon]
GTLPPLDTTTTSFPAPGAARKAPADPERRKEVDDMATERRRTTARRPPSSLHLVTRLSV